MAKTKGKGKTKGKILKRKQRLRIEKGKVRAEAVGDKLERRRGVGRRGGGRNVSLFFLVFLVCVCVLGGGKESCLWFCRGGGFFVCVCACV